MLSFKESKTPEKTVRLLLTDVWARVSEKGSRCKVKEIWKNRSRIEYRIQRAGVRSQNRNRVQGTGRKVQGKRIKGATTLRHRC